ncbi:MAG: ribosome-binding factor A [Sediminibacterium sp.]|nr:ribosome-binding factor A [Sediminibacterium sp.]
MEFSKRQLQVAALLKTELHDIFLRMQLHFIQGSLVSISQVKITPDLLEARIYISIHPSENQDFTLNIIKEKHSEIKRHLAAKAKHQLRRIPEINFYLDDTLDYVFKMESIFQKIKTKTP